MARNMETDVKRDELKEMQEESVVANSNHIWLGVGRCNNFLKYALERK